MTTTTKDIYLLVNAATCSGRGYMQGVLSEIARQTAWRLHICDRDTVGYRSLVETIRTNRLDGFITSKLEDPRLEAILQSSDIPLVVIGTRENCLPARIHDIRIVTLNEQKIGAAAARHFLRMGKFAAYGYVHFREEYCQYLSRQRERGFIDELARSGIEGMSFARHSTDEILDIAALEDWLRALPKPSAVLAGHDRRAREVLEASTRLGIKVPDEIRILSIDNDELVCMGTTPTLSSIDTDNEAIGREAVQQLRLILRRGRGNGKVERKTIFAKARLSVVDRGSTSVLPPGLTLVQRGMDYIHRNAKRDMTVDDVVTFLGVSRRLAYLRFEEFEKKSIRKAIVDARLGAVKQMLSGTRLTIGAISRECGFDNPNGLKMLFKRETGMTMRDWRRLHPSSAKARR